MKNEVPGRRNPGARGPGRARAARRAESGRGAAPSLADRAVERALAGRRTRSEDEVARLVAATFALIERSGSLEPRVGDIVGRAGLSNQAFYRHFPGKRALLVAVLDEGVRILEGYLEQRMAGAESPVGRIREWMRGMLAQALSPSAAAATRPFALGRGRLADDYPAEVAASESRLTALLRDAIRDARDAGELPDADPERDAETLYHQAMGWLQARLCEGRPAQRDDAERLVAFALHGLARGAPPPAETGALRRRVS